MLSEKEKLEIIKLRLKYDRYFNWCEKKSKDPLSIEDFEIMMKDRIAQRDRFIKDSLRLYNKITPIIVLVIGILMKTIMIGLLGFGSFFTIYLINQPVFGLKYALFASCAISGLLWMLLPNFFFSQNNRSVKE